MRSGSASKRKALDMSPKAVRERWKKEQKKIKVQSRDLFPMTLLAPDLLLSTESPLGAG